MSGTLNGSRPFSTAPRIELVWDVTSQNVSNNTSQLRLRTYLRAEYTIVYSATKSGNTTADGTGRGWSSNTSRSGTGRWLLRTENYTISHNSNGAKSLNISSWYDLNISMSGGRVNRLSVSGSITLPTIARASSLNSFSVNSQLQIGQSNNQLNVSVSRQSSSFTHDFTLRAGDTFIGEWTGQGLPSSLSLNSTHVSRLLNAMGTSTTRSITLRMQTKNGNTNIGGVVSRNANVTIHSSVTPNVTGLNLSIAGHAKGISLGMYVQNQSRVNISFDATTTGGASYLTSTTARVEQVGGGQNYVQNGTLAQFRNGVNSNILTGSGTYRITAGATDSRGRTTTINTTFTVTAYSPPNITTFTVDRGVQTPSTVVINRRGVFSHLNGGNMLTVDVLRAVLGSTNYTRLAGPSGTSSSGSFGATVNQTGNNVSRSYSFRLVITDEFGNSAESEQIIGTEYVVFAIDRDVRVGIGKKPENGILDVAGAAFFSGEINVRPVVSGDQEGAAINILSNDASGHGYIQFINPSGTRTGYIGFPSANSNHIAIENENGGNVNIRGNDLVVNNQFVANSGQNSNGWWVRYYDGTQMCYNRASMSLDNASFSTQRWHYPVVFSVTPAAFAVRDGYTGGGQNHRGATFGVGESLSYVDVTYFSGTTSIISGNRSVRFFAIGRWY